MRWMTEVSSSVYSTPLITDLYSDGQKDIVIPGFVHYLEVGRKTSACQLGIQLNLVMHWALDIIKHKAPSEPGAEHRI